MEEKIAQTAEDTSPEPTATVAAAAPPPVIDLERVATLRQQYIDRFFTKNPSLSMFNIPFNKQTNIRNICVDPRIISHPLYRRSLPAHHVSSQSTIPMIVTRSLSESLCLEKSRAVLDLTRPGSLAITCMAMDRHHALLACGNERGVLSVYDVDEATFSIQLKRHVLVPTIVIDTKRSISQIVWNPRSGHEDEILLMFHFSCDAWLYNLSKLPEEAGYLRIFSPKTVRTGGSTAGLFWTATTTTTMTTTPSSSGSSSQLLMVGGSNGYVRCWRIRFSSPSAAPEAQWSMRVTQAVSDVPVVFLYQWPGTSHLMAINALGMVAIWDIDRTEAVAFSSTGREPALLYTFDFFPLIAPYLVSPSSTNSSSADYAAHVQQVLPVPMAAMDQDQQQQRDDVHGTRQFTLLFQSGLLCTIDLDRQQVIDILPRYQMARGGGGGQSMAAPAIGGRTNESMTIHMDALTSAATTTGTGHEGSNVTGASAAGKVSVTTMALLRSFPGSPPMILLVQPQVDLHSKAPTTTTATATATAPATTAMLRFLQWIGHRRVESRRYAHQPPSYAVTGLLRPQPGTALVQSALLKAPDFCYTLPGRVIRATPGQREVFVSDDLQHYLDSVVMANSSWSRSSDLRLEWLQSSSHTGADEKPPPPLPPVHNDAVVDGGDGSGDDVTTAAAAATTAAVEDEVDDDIVDDDDPVESAERQGPSSAASRSTPTSTTAATAIYDDITVAFTQQCRIEAYAAQDAVVHHLQAHSVVLDRAYEGPVVVDGHPRVQLRTKLLAQQFPSPGTVGGSAVHARTMAHVTSYSDNDEDHAAFLQWHACSWPPASSSSNSNSSGIITSVLVHPTLPLIFLGQDDGRIVTLSTQRGAGFASTSTITTTATATATVASGDPAATVTTNVYDLYEQQQLQQQQAQRLARAAQAMAQDEALVAAEAARQQHHNSNMWRADVSLSSSYRRTHTQILDARPTTATAATTAVSSASSSSITTTAGVTSAAPATTTTAIAPVAVDEDLERMQSIFQRNAAARAAPVGSLPSLSARPVGPVGPVGQTQSKPAQKSLFTLMRPAGSASSKGAASSTAAAAASSSSSSSVSSTSTGLGVSARGSGGGPPASVSAKVSTTAALAPPPPPPSSSRASMGLTARSSLSSSASLSMKAPAPAASAMGTTTSSLSAVLAGQKRKREMSLGASSSVARPVPSKPPALSQSSSLSSAASASSVGVWRNLLSAQTHPAASTSARTNSSSDSSNGSRASNKKK